MDLRSADKLRPLALAILPHMKGVVTSMPTLEKESPSLFEKLSVLVDHEPRAAAMLLLRKLHVLSWEGFEEFLNALDRVGLKSVVEGLFGEGDVGAPGSMFDKCWPEHRVKEGWAACRVMLNKQQEDVFQESMGGIRSLLEGHQRLCDWVEGCVLIRGGLRLAVVLDKERGCLEVAVRGVEPQGLLGAVLEKIRETAMRMSVECLMENASRFPFDLSREGVYKHVGWSCFRKGLLVGAFVLFSF